MVENFSIFHKKFLPRFHRKLFFAPLDSLLKLESGSKGEDSDAGSWPASLSDHDLHGLKHK